MVKYIPSDFAIFFDDGGVMNDNNLRGVQWQKLVGEFFIPKYGGEAHKWAEGNFKFINQFIAEEMELTSNNGELPEYKEYYANFQSRWITDMFEYVGIQIPPKNLHKKIFLEATDYITPNIKASFPGVIEAIRRLYSRGFRLFTASAEHSHELKGYLRGMRVKDCFENFYGPDLINTHKDEEKYFERIFKDLNLNPKMAIVVEDNLMYLKAAENTGATVVQACLTGKHKQEYRHYVEHMSNLPEIIEKIVKKIKR